MSLVRAIDVASYQPADLTALVQATGATHVIVRLPVTAEGHAYYVHSQAQIASAQSLGCTVGGYGWAYGDIDPVLSCSDMLAVFRPPVLWLDVERSTYTPPDLNWISRWGTECDRQGVRKGLYSSAEQWKALFGFANAPGTGWLGWAAGYNGKPDLEIEGFGGVYVVGHQFLGDQPCDQSVFIESATQ